MIVLGIDPGSYATGYALLNVRGRDITVHRSGIIRLGRAVDLSDRLSLLYEQLYGVLREDTPRSVAVEDVFSAKNARSALALGQARGVILAAVGSYQIPVTAYPPASVKRAVAGHGRADKHQMQQMMKVLLKLQSVPPTDEADAMAVGFCHALRQKGIAMGSR